MSTEPDLILTDNEQLALSALSEAFEAIVGDIVDSRTYLGPDAHYHAQNQAQRELVSLLVDLARARRDPPQDPAHLIERLPQATVDAALARVEREDGHGGEL